jgi:hypothetical protein
MQAQRGIKQEKEKEKRKKKARSRMRHRRFASNRRHKGNSVIGTILIVSTVL